MRLNNENKVVTLAVAPKEEISEEISDEDNVESTDTIQSDKNEIKDETLLQDTANIVEIDPSKD